MLRCFWEGDVRVMCVGVKGCEGEAERLRTQAFPQVSCQFILLLSSLVSDVDPIFAVVVLQNTLPLTRDVINSFVNYFGTRSHLFFQYPCIGDFVVDQPYSQHRAELAFSREMLVCTCLFGRAAGTCEDCCRSQIHGGVGRAQTQLSIRPPSPSPLGWSLLRRHLCR